MWVMLGSRLGRGMVVLGSWPCVPGRVGCWSAGGGCGWDASCLAKYWRRGAVCMAAAAWCGGHTVATILGHRQTFVCVKGAVPRARAPVHAASSLMNELSPFYSRCHVREASQREREERREAEALAVRAARKTEGEFGAGGGWGSLSEQ